MNKFINTMMHALGNIFIGVFLFALIMLLVGCVTEPEPWCVDIIIFVPGYEAQVSDSLSLSVHPDSLTLMDDKAVIRRPDEVCGI